MDQDEMLKVARQLLDYLEVPVSRLPTAMLDDDSERPTTRTEEELILAHYREDTLRSIKTVRFITDFARYNAGYDFDTKNESFVRTAKIYRDMGVKNYYFHLQLNNPLLKGVDPYSPLLTEEQKLMILHECRTNFWYFIREVCIVGGGNRFRANRANISFIWSYLCHINTILILPRQQGKTVSAQAIIFWLEYINGRGYESHLITLKDDNRSQFIEALKTIRNSIPSWLTNVTYRDKDAGNSLTYSAFGEDKKNILRISVPQIGEEAARNVGRGLTVKTRMIDEPAYIKHMEAILNGAGPSTLTARENARRLGEPYGTGFITTPASVISESGRYMYDMLMNSTEWRETYFDSFSETHLYGRLLKASPIETTSPMLGMVYNYLQLGKNRDWVKRTIDELKLSLSEAKIDLLLMWDDNGKGKLFDDLTREALNNGKRPIEWSQEVGETGLFIDWFISREEHTRILMGENKTHYVIGCDTSAAVNRDACTVIIRDVADGRVVGTGRYQRAYLTDVGEVLTALLVEITNSTLVIERNYAHHMIDQLLITLPALGIVPFKRVFNQIYQFPEKHENELREIRQRTFANRNSNFYLKYKQHFGFITTPRTREELYGFLQEAVGCTGDKIYFNKLIDEIVDLKQKNDRIDHDSKGHDDLVVAWLLGFWFMKLGQSKSEYGIPPGIVLSKITLMRVGDAANESMDDEQRDAQIRLYKAKLEQLTDHLLKTNDPAIAQRIEIMIRKLAEYIPPETRKTMTIDDTLRRAKEEREKRLLEVKRKRSRYAA